MPPLSLRVPAEGSLRTVLLRHELPDGSSHIDWMLEPDIAEDRLLVCFRLSEPVDGLLAGGQCEAERIHNHRRAYLDYQGVVSGGRGSVARLRAGQITRILEATATELAFDCIWKEGKLLRRQQLRLRNTEKSKWMVFCVRIWQDSGQNG